MEKFRIGLWTSAWDRAAWDLVREVFKNVESGFIPATEVSFVLVTRKEGETQFGNFMLGNLWNRGYPAITFSSLNFKPELRRNDRGAWRLEHDRELMKLLPETDLDVLLGYMWIAGKELCPKRTMINLHPALPTGPKGTYREVIWQLIRERARETGVMIHLVIPELDQGPAIAFCRFSIRGGDFDPLWNEMAERLEKESLEEITQREGENNPLFAMIRQRGVIREFPMVIGTIKIILERRVRVKKGKIMDAKGQVLEGGYDLSQEIDAAIKNKI